METLNKNREHNVTEIYQLREEKPFGVGDVASVIGRGLGTVLFYVLAFLQPVVRMVTGYVWPLTLVLAGFAWYAFPEKAEIWHGLVVISVLSFVAALGYDWLLMKLAPRQ